MASIQNTSSESSISAEEWSWVEGLIREVSREEQTDLLARKVFQWDLAVRQFRKVENDRIVLGCPTSIDFEGHARCLEALLMIGRALVLASRQYAPEELARFGIKHEEPEACVEALEQSFREWHHGFSQEHLEEVRKALFGAKT
jgi:hypothetical protein